MVSDKPSVVEAWSAVMAEVQAVGKTGFNKQQSYNFRGIDAVVNAAGPALRKHGVLVMPTVLNATYRDVEVGKNRTAMREVTVEVRYTIFGPAGDVLAVEGLPNLGTVFGEAMDSGDKGTAKATSVAYRIFLLQALCIPTDEPDPDSSSYERAPQQASQPESADPRISKANADALRKTCADRRLDVAKVVKLGTDGRTEDPGEVHKDEVRAVKQAMDDLEAQANAIADAASPGGHDGGTPAVPWEEQHPDEPY